MTWGRAESARIREEYADLAQAATAGSDEALDVLLSLAAQSGYASGYGAAATTAGALL